jgi:hypothetical protein
MIAGYTNAKMYSGPVGFDAGAIKYVRLIRENPTAKMNSTLKKSPCGSA